MCLLHVRWFSRWGLENNLLVMMMVLKSISKGCESSTARMLVARLTWAIFQASEQARHESVPKGQKSNGSPSSIHLAFAQNILHVHAPLHEAGVACL